MSEHKTPTTADGFQLQIIRTPSRRVLVVPIPWKTLPVGEAGSLHPERIPERVVH